MTLAALTLHDAGEKLRRREISSVALTEAVFERIAGTDGKVHAYLTLDRDSAIDRREHADDASSSGDKHSPLLGIPLRLKIIFSPAVCARPARRKFWATLFRPTTRPQSETSRLRRGHRWQDQFGRIRYGLLGGKLGAFSDAVIRGISSAFPVVLRAARPPPSPPINASRPWEPTPADLSANRQHAAASSDSNRPMAGLAATASSLSLHPWTKSDR